MERIISDKMTRRALLATLGAAGTAAVTGSLLGGETVFGKRVTDDVYGNGNGNGKANGWVGSTPSPVINVKDFGAVGDGIADDTAAFRAANLYGYNRARAASGQVIPTAAMDIFIPSGLYRIKGTKIFGSPVPEGQAGSALPAIMFSVTGHNATLAWDLDSADDELFYFDGTIDTPQVTGLTIYPVSENNTISVGGTVFKYYNNVSLGYANASKSFYENVTVVSGRAKSNFNFSTRPKFVFKSIGNAMSDQSLVSNCRFSYFETMFHSENQESVNWTFQSCGIYGGGWSGNTTYFSFTKMGDNFNVNNCSFSITSNETLLKARSPVDGNNKYTQTAHYSFHFRDNRIELYGNSGTSWYLCDMNFGRFNLSGTNVRLASGSSNVKTIVSAYGLANLCLDNVAFNETEFRFPILIDQAIIGAASAYGALIKNCDFIKGKVYFTYTNGTTVYSLQDILVSGLLYRHVRLENCTYVNRNGFLDFDIANCNSGLSTPAKQERQISYSSSGVALGKTYELPPYQVVKKIVLALPTTLPASYDKFRVYFGDKSLNNFIDIENPKPSAEPKNDFVLFEGMSTIFNSNLVMQSITVYVLNGGVESGGILSEITVAYEPLDPKVFNITASANTIQVRRKSSTIHSGTTLQRPTFNVYAGQPYFDTTIGKPIWHNGTSWVDAVGTVV